MKTKLLFLLSLLILSATVQASDPISRAIDEIMVLSGTEKQLANLDQSIIAGMEDGFIQQGGALPEALRSKVQTAASQAYDEVTLKKQVRQQLKQKLSINDIKQLMKWLKSDTGRKITQAEEQASTPDAMVEAIQTSQSIQISDLRSQLFKTLDQSVNMTQSITDMAIFTAVAVSTGMVAGLPVEQRPPYSQIQASIDGMRPSMETTIKQQIDMMLKYTYRNISDTELQQYLAFNQSREGQKYNKAIIKGFEKAMNNSALTFGDLLSK